VIGQVSQEAFVPRRFDGAEGAHHPLARHDGKIPQSDDRITAKAACSEVAVGCANHLVKPRDGLVSLAADAAHQEIPKWGHLAKD